MTTLLDLRSNILTAIMGDVAAPVLYDLGCGQNPESGFVGVDYYSNSDGVLKADLTSYPWPFPAGSVDYFRASHFVEHVPDWDAHFTEIYSALKMGGHYEIVSPYYLNNRWFQDPDHKQPILQERFMYLDQKWKKANKIDHYGARVNFAMVAWFEALNEDFVDDGTSDYDRQYQKRHLFNVIDDVALVLKKIPMEAAVA